MNQELRSFLFGRVNSGGAAEDSKMLAALQVNQDVQDSLVYVHIINAVRIHEPCSAMYSFDGLVRPELRDEVLQDIFKSLPVASDASYTAYVTCIIIRKAKEHGLEIKPEWLHCLRTLGPYFELTGLPDPEKIIKTLAECQ